MRPDYEQMDQKFMKKMGNGKLFSLWAKNNKGSGKAGAVAFAVIGVFLLFGALSSLLTLLDSVNEGETGEAGIGAVVLAVEIIAAIILFILTRWAMKRGKLTEDELIKRDCEHNSLSESELREFERQAFESDSKVLHFDLIDGIATKDYLWLGEQAVPQTIIRRSDIVAMAVVRRKNYVGKSGSVATYLYVVSKQGNTLEGSQIVTSGYLEASKPINTLPDGRKVYKGLTAFVPTGGEEKARNVIKMLKGDREDIITPAAVLDREKDFDRWYDGIWERI